MSRVKCLWLPFKMWNIAVFTVHFLDFVKFWFCSDKPSIITHPNLFVLNIICIIFLSGRVAQVRADILTTWKHNQCKQPTIHPCNKSRSCYDGQTASPKQKYTQHTIKNLTWLIYIVQTSILWGTICVYKSSSNIQKCFYIYKFYIM